MEVLTVKIELLTEFTRFTEFTTSPSLMCQTCQTCATRRGLDNLRITAFIHGNPPKRYVEELAKRKAGLATKCEPFS